MLKKIIRKRYLFVCMAIAIGAMIYCTTATSQATTILSDQEMTKLKGKNTPDCACAEYYEVDCLAPAGAEPEEGGCEYGSSGCGGVIRYYADVRRIDTRSNFAPNGYKVSPGTMRCWTDYSRTDGAVMTNKFCAAYILCNDSPGDTCRQCYEGVEVGHEDKNNNRCVPI